MQCDENTHNDQSSIVVPLTRPPVLSLPCVSMEIEDQEDAMVENTGIKDRRKRKAEKRESNRSDLVEADR